MPFIIKHPGTHLLIIRIKYYTIGRIEIDSMNYYSGNKERLLTDFLLFRFASFILSLHLYQTLGVSAFIAV